MDDPILPITATVETATGTTLTFPAGSTYPPLRVALRDATDSPVSLSNAARVRLRVENGDGVLLDQPADILDRADGRVEYTWHEHDTATPGSYDARFIVQTVSGRTLKAPSRYPLSVNIVDGGTG